MSGDQLIRRFRNQLAGYYFLRYTLYCLIFSAFVGGIAILTVRGLWGRGLPVDSIALIAAAVITGALVYSLVRSLRDLPSLDALRIVFDKFNYCGGLLMTASEMPIGTWTERISSVRCPQITWRARRLSLMSLSAIVFLGLSFLIPQRYIASGSPGRLEIEDQTSQLRQQIDVLEEEDIIVEEVAREIHQNVDMIEDTASGRDPVKTWESMGHLQEQLKKAAEEASVGMLAETEQLTKVETLAQAMSRMDGQMSDEAMEGAMSELSQLVQSLMKENEALQKALGGPFNEALNAEQLSAEQLQQLLEALRDRKLELVECTGRLCEAKLADMKLLKLCEGKCEGDGEALMLLLSGCGSSQDSKDAVALFMNSPNWGVNRGRGDAPMVWSDPSSKQGTAFKEQILPEATLAAMKDVQLVGVSISAPSLEEGDDHLVSGDLDSAQAGNAQAIKRTILPKHKAVVEDYFERDTEE